ncbi:asparagine-rich protein-like [Carica papaya]|uniref:asparagine-rich protein-like n=1 Tax=Carica papaya TaxID=3649 RepID=UPI000B8C85C7|nr:asparagine-rich protein-like [Carica papaya]
MRCYEVNPEKINTILEADVYQNFLMTSLRQVQQMKAEMLSTESSSSKSKRNRLNLEPIEDENEADDNLGPHLTLHYLLKKANDGKFQIGVDKSNSNNINDNVVGDGDGNGNGKRNRSANNNRSGSASGSCNSNGGGK